MARWYVIHVYSGSEMKVAQSIREKVEKQGVQDRVLDVVVPTHKAFEIRRGKKVETEKKFFPGYVLIQMDLDDDVWRLVRNEAKVTGFLGGKDRPTPISNAEAERMLQQLGEGASAPVDVLSFEIGEQVRVSDGPFSSFNGVVDEVDAEKGRLKVMVSIFGRATPVDLEFSQVEKL